jgi:hypothetical protein
MAATVSNGVFTKITDTGAHGYSRSVTTVDYSFNEVGPVGGCGGVDGGGAEQRSVDGHGPRRWWTLGRWWTSRRRSCGEHVSVIVGQAQVVKSVTTSYAATVAKGVFTKITDTGAHGYSRSVTTVDYSFNELGQLMGATGRRWGTRTARCGRTRTGTVVDAGEMVDQPTTFSVVNTYAVIVGSGAGGEERDDELCGDGGEWVYSRRSRIRGRMGIAGA